MTSLSLLAGRTVVFYNFFMSLFDFNFQSLHARIFLWFFHFQLFFFFFSKLTSKKVKIIQEYYQSVQMRRLICQEIDLGTNCLARVNLSSPPPALRKSKRFLGLGNMSTINLIRPSDKSVSLKTIFLISQPKYMLWVRKRTVSMRRFFWAPKTLYV